MVVHVQLHQTELWGREGEKLDKAHIDKNTKTDMKTSGTE
jgi:hypothetical protein